MTIVDDIVFPAATNEDASIVPEGRWTLELLRIEDAPPSSFRPEDGRRFKWVFALYDGPGLQPGERFHFNSEPYEFFRFTTKKNSPRATARKYAEALIGKRFEDGYVPTLREMLGRRMSGVVTYEVSEFDPSQQVLKLSSLKSVAAPSPTGAKRPAPAPGPQIGPDASDTDVERALIVTTLRKQVEKLARLDEDAGAAAADALAQSDLETAEPADLQSLLDSVNAAITKAAAA